MSLILSVLLAITPAAANESAEPMEKAGRELLPAVPAADWQNFIRDLAAAEAKPHLDPELSRRSAELLKQAPDTPRGRLLRLTFQARTAAAAKDPVLFRQSYRDGAALMPLLEQLPATEALAFLFERIRQTAALLSSYSERNSDAYCTAWMQARHAMHSALARLLAASPADTGELELAAKTQTLEAWENCLQLMKFRIIVSKDLPNPEHDIPVLTSPSPSLETLVAATRLHLLKPDLASDVWLHEATALEARLQQQIAAHPDLLSLKFQLLRLGCDFLRGPEALKPLADTAFRQAPRDGNLHREWAACLSFAAGGSAALLKERIETLSRDPEAFTEAGSPLCLIYLSQLTAREGNEVLQESWVSDSLCRCLEHLEGRPSTPNLALRRSQLIGKLLPAADKSLMPRLLRRYDLLKDLDLPALRPEINGPLDLARLCVSGPQLSLVETVEKALGWQAGKPFDRAIPAAQLLEWATALDAAATSAEHPHAAGCCRQWARLCRLQEEYLRGDWVTLPLDDLWLWRRSSGDFAAGPDGLLASSMYGKPLVAQHRADFPLPCEVEVQLTPIKVYSDTYSDRCDFFGIACGNLVSRPLSGRILFSDPAIGWSGSSAMQPFVGTSGEGTKTASSAVIHAWIWPDEAEVCSLPELGFSTLHEQLVFGEAPFLPGAIGIGCPAVAHGSVRCHQLRVRRVSLPATPPVEATARIDYWTRRFAQMPTDDKMLKLIESHLDAGQADAALKLAAGLPTGSPPGIDELAGIVAKINFNYAINAELKARASADLGQWPEAIREMRQSLVMTPDDDALEAGRRRMQLAIYLARTPASTVEDLKEASETVAFALRQSSPLLRLHAWRAQAWLHLRAGRKDAAIEAQRCAEMLATEHAPELSAKLKKEADDLRQ